MFTFNALNEGIDTLTDFNITEDIIDLRNIFRQPQYTDVTPYVQFLKYIQVTPQGSNTLIRIDADGNGVGKELITVATLTNVSGLTARNFVIG
ncbi:MAG: type I secretion C-terminal target domain-containing protein [Oculatellaceae cyanobacterium Prado106]|jgi:hypothetical protein|nr:type I secretion C-terminal target domain-containing protein [Oculatellaceae cyanobacterium Prado106]